VAVPNLPSLLHWCAVPFSLSPALTYQANSSKGLCQWIQNAVLMKESGSSTNEAVFREAWNLVKASTRIQCLVLVKPHRRRVSQRVVNSH
jgi:hypothetical protein